MSEEMTTHQLLVAFMLEQIEREPADKALLLYRALAIEVKDPQLAKRCNELADAIVRLQRAQRQLLLDFKRRAAG